MSCEVIKGLVNDGFTLVLFLHLNRKELNGNNEHRLAFRRRVRH